MGHRGRPAVQVALTTEQRVELERRVRGQTSTQREVRRARIILGCAEGDSAKRVGRLVGVHPRTVEEWRARFLRKGLDGLLDKPRSGHKPKFGPVTRCEVIALACEPVKTVEGRTRRTLEDVRCEAVARGIVESISWSSVQRILSQVDLRPHLVQGWLHSPDPQFRSKVNEIVELYLHRPAGSIVLSIDEKPGMQALQRRFPDRPAAPGRRRRREFEYKRHGTQTLLSALDVHTGRVITHCGATRTAADLVRFMERIAAEYPDLVVHVIWDNLNIHFDGADDRWTKFNQRHGQRFVFHYTPLHASWVNQVELFFSILQNQCLRDGNFASTEELRDTVLAFVDGWNRRAHPFRWTFTGYPLQAGPEHTQRPKRSHDEEHVPQAAVPG